MWLLPPPPPTHHHHHHQPRLTWRVRQSVCPVLCGGHPAGPTRWLTWSLPPAGSWGQEGGGQDVLRWQPQITPVTYTLQTMDCRL
jgi:hypothetical protein